MLKFSFIIPVFNGEQYLEKCLMSIASQKLENLDIEIICIDDKSADNSVAVIERLQKEISNLVLIRNEINLKTGTVCNMGFDNSTGDYLWFVGQDDWIEDNSLKRLMNIIQDSEPEVIAFNYSRVDFSEKKLHSAEVFDNTGMIDGPGYIRKRFGESFPHYLLGYEWRAVYKKEYLLTNNIRFPDGVIYEDTTFLFKSLLYTSKLYTISDYLYFYRVNEASITDFSKKYRGDLIYEFAFISGNEVLSLARDTERSHPDFSSALFEMAKWYFNGFVPKVVSASIKQKWIFYQFVSGDNNHRLLPNEYLNSLSKVLINSQFGFIFSILFTPLYYVKRLTKKKKSNERKWCY